MEQQSKLASQALENLHKVIKEKTRFEPDEVALVAENVTLQEFTVTVEHQLDAPLTSRKITGHFLTRDPSEKCEVPDPIKAIEEEQPSRLKLAADQLKRVLDKPETTYNLVTPGTFLTHARKYWALFICKSCGGRRRVRCHNCGGSKKQECDHCRGHKKVRCSAGCNNGKVNCSTCNGRGRIDYQVPFTDHRQKSVSTWNQAAGRFDNHYITETFTNYRTASKGCTASGCQYGKVNCTICHGSGEVNCPTCFATGEIECRTCGGNGTLPCEPCEESGKTGIAAWVDVNVAPQYFSALSAGATQDALAVANTQGVHGLPLIASSFSYEKSAITGIPPATVTAQYDGKFNLVQLQTACRGSQFNLVAYGNDLRWLTQDRIIERLLQDDLKALSDAIVESANEGLFSSKIDDLLDKLKHVAASEINVDIVEAALADKELTEHKGAVSEEYAKSVKHGIQVTLRRIYVRTAKGFAWKTVLATLLIGFGVWAFEGLMWAGISVATVLLLSFLLHRRSIRNLLTDILGTPEFAERAMKVASKGSGGREAALLLSLPSVVLALGIGWALPKQPPFSHKGADQSISSTSEVENPIPRESNSQSINKPKVVEQTSTAIQNPGATTIDQDQKSNPASQADKKTSSNPLAMQSSGAPQQAHTPPRSEEPIAGNGQTNTKLDTHSESDLRIAENMLSSGNYRNAYDLAKRVLAKHPENVRATNIANSAQSEMQKSSGKSLGQVQTSQIADSSTTDVKTNATLDPHSETQLRIAEKMFNDGYYNNAYELAKRVLVNHPDNARALHIASSAQSEMARSQGK